MSNIITTKSKVEYVEPVMHTKFWNSLRFILNHICMVPTVAISCRDASWYSWEQRCILLGIEFFGTPRFIFLFIHSNRRARILRLNPLARMAKLGHTEIRETEELEASAALEHPDGFISLSCVAFRCFRIPFSCSSIILQTCDINERQVIFYIHYLGCILLTLINSNASMYK